MAIATTFIAKFLASLKVEVHIAFPDSLPVFIIHDIAEYLFKDSALLLVECHQIELFLELVNDR